MPKSLLEQLPEIVANGRREAEKILEGLEGRHRIGLQTREWVLPSRDTAATDWIDLNNHRRLAENGTTASWSNRMVYGDNLLAMAAFIAGDNATPSMRGQIDLIYVDPPFDSKADYRTKVSLPGLEMEQKPTVIEQLAYSDMNDSRLEVLVVPPDLLDRLKKKGSIDKLRGQVRFSSLQYLTLQPLRRERVADTDDGTPQEALSVSLKNYVLLSPEAINLDEANRAKLQAVANADPLVLIEYWAVDPDYDGELFRSVWQDYRGNTANNADSLRVVPSTTLTLPYRRSRTTSSRSLVSPFWSRKNRLLKARRKCAIASSLRRHT